MKISEIIKRGTPSLSFEVFPPKNSESYESIKSSALEIAKLNPDFMSVTYGAGGTTGSYTIDIAESIVKTGVTPIAHLTCVCSDRNKIRETLTEIKSKGVENILALRGDMPDGITERSLDFTHASDLVKEIKDFGGFCIGGACYPEGHTECDSFTKDIQNLKIKVDAGC